MKALSIKQPWLNLILLGEKTIEVRSRKTSHRGELLLCASKTPALSKARMDAMEEDLGRPYHLGHALCTTRVVESRPLEAGDEEAAALNSISPSMVGWILEAIRPVIPFPVKGQLGLYEVDDGLITVSPFALWETVRVKDPVQPDDTGLDKGGWHGRIAEIEIFGEDSFLYCFMPDSISTREIPLAHIQACVQEQLSWNTFMVHTDDLEPAGPRDTEEEMAEAIKDIIQKNPSLFPEGDLRNNVAHTR